MRTNIFSVLLTLLLCSSYNGFSQGSTNEFPWQISDISLTFGEVRGIQSYITLEEARAKFPSSALLQEDYSNFYAVEGKRHFGLGEQPVAQFSMGFRKSSPEASWLTRKSSFRLGAMVIGMVSDMGYWGVAHTGAYDTLTSANTGQQFIIDSTLYSNLNYVSRQMQVQVSAAWMVDIVRSPKWNVQMGIAASAGLAADHYAEVNWSNYSVYHQEMYSSNYSGSFYSSYGSYGSFDYNRNFYKPSVAGTVSVPVSACFNLGRGLADKWQLGLVYEGKPSFLFGGRSAATPSLIQQLGVRLMLPDKGI